MLLFCPQPEESKPGYHLQPRRSYSPSRVTVCCTYSPPQSHRHRPNSEERRLVKITMQERQSQEGRGKRDTEVREGGQAGLCGSARSLLRPTIRPTDDRKDERGAAGGGGGGGGVMGGAAGAHGGYRGATRRGGGGA